MYIRIKLQYIIILIIAIIISLVAACHQTRQNKALDGIKSLPSFKFLSLDSACCIDTKAILPGEPTVFFYFDPECELCQKETEAILKNYKGFKSVGFYFLSHSSLKQIRSFSKYYQLDHFTNIFIGQEYQFSFFNVFLPPSIPYMIVYNSKRSLSKIYFGAADMPSLIASTRN
jgi:hypothetical protein